MEKSNLYPFVLAALRNREHSDEDIANMSANEIFREYCEWHGLINWANTLISVLDNARAVVNNTKAKS